MINQPSVYAMVVVALMCSACPTYDPPSFTDTRLTFCNRSDDTLYYTVSNGNRHPEEEFIYHSTRFQTELGQYRTATNPLYVAPNKCDGLVSYASYDTLAEESNFGMVSIYLATKHDVRSFGWEQVVKDGKFSHLTFTLDSLRSSGWSVDWP